MGSLGTEGDDETRWRQAIFDQGERGNEELDRIRRAVEKIWFVVLIWALITLAAFFFVGVPYLRDH